MTWPRAMFRHFSQSAASMASRNAFEPLALVRSPTMVMPVSWVSGMVEYSEATSSVRFGSRSARVAGPRSA